MLTVFTSARERWLFRALIALLSLSGIAFGIRSAAALPAASSQSAPAIELTPHRAVYDLALENVRGASNVSGVQGRMVFEFTGSACEGYALSMRLVTRIVDQSGNAAVSDLRSATWESGDGKRFRFSTTHRQNEQVREVTRGSAEKTGGEGPVRIELTKPAPEELEVQGPVLFPTEHSFAILNAAHADKNILQARVYDGSDTGRKVYATTAFIGRRLAPDSRKSLERVENDAPLDGLPAWPVSISYFDAAKENQQTPEYELSFRLYDNGVSRKLKIDYGGFAVQGALESLEFLSTPDCD